MTTNIMGDIETLGTGRHALVLSIGACKFNATEIVDKFHVAIDPVNAQALGLNIEAGTVMWWLDPERAPAREQLLKHERHDLVTALHGFASWIGDADATLWGNGATFDNIVLRDAYAAAGLDYPIRFWNDACYRTIKNRRPDIKLVREGVHHDALDDAVSQAKHLQAICAGLGISL